MRARELALGVREVAGELRDSLLADEQPDEDARMTPSVALPLTYRSSKPARIDAESCFCGAGSHSSRYPSRGSRSRGG
jgi:hypothetical protein